MLFCDGYGAVAFKPRRPIRRLNKAQREETIGPSARNKMDDFSSIHPFVRILSPVALEIRRPLSFYNAP